MKIKDFYELVESNREPEASLLPNLQYRIKKYPYFQADIFIYIKCLYLSSSEDFAEELVRLAPFVSDRKALFYYVMNDQYRQFQQKVEKRLTPNRTDMLINAFFGTLNEPETDNVLSNFIDHPNLVSTDYFSYLKSLGNEDSQNIETTLNEAVSTTSLSLDSFTSLDNIDLLETQDGIEIEAVDNNTAGKSEIEEDDTPSLRHQDIIDQFITKASGEENLRIQLKPTQETLSEDDEPDSSEIENTEDELQNDYFFTQTLANIYIKQKKYKRAYEIIKHLSLNYPEKNIYFADQLSFLEKLIKNTNIK